MTDRLPRLFQLAAPRSGSTQFSRWLTQHPQIGGALVKEPNFYSSADYPADSRGGDVDPERFDPANSRQYHAALFRRPADYQRLYSMVEGDWLLDASVSYLSSRTAPARVAAEVDDPRFIVLLRDPVERAISAHAMAIRIGSTTRPLGEVLDEISRSDSPTERPFIRQSRYGEALDRWATHFPLSSFKFVVFEHMVAEPDVVLADVCDWLDIEEFVFDTVARDSNARSAPRSAALNSALHRSGIKGWARRVAPVGVKRRLKSIYFKPAPPSPDDQAVRARLEEYLASERDAVAQYHPAVARWWPTR